MNFFVRKSCLKHLRQYLNTLVKSTVQKTAHNTANIIFEKRQYLKARLKKLFKNASRNTVVNGFRKEDLSKNSSKSTNWNTAKTKTSPIFFSKKDRIENLLNKYAANVPYKLLGKVRSHEETVLKRSSKTFWTEKLPKTPKNLDFEKKTVSKILSRSMSYTEVAYNTVETALSGNRSDSRGSSNSHWTKNQPKTPLKFFSIGRPYRILFRSVAYKKFERTTVKRLLSKRENLPRRSFHQSCTLKNLS